MNLLNATPTEYVWKYNPLFGIPAGAQQNYGAAINWVVTGGRGAANAVEEIRRRTLAPSVTRAVTAQFDAQSDEQPFPTARETNYIIANVVDSGPSKAALTPLDFSGEQRVQMTGGRTEGRTQLTGGLTEGRTQLTGGLLQAPAFRAPRWSGIVSAGSSLREDAESASDTFKYFLRTEGPSQVVDEPGVYSQRKFMTTFLPAIVKHPFDSRSPGTFPAQFSAIYKGRTAFEDTFWDW